jgi:hypothetical protein
MVAAVLGCGEDNGSGLFGDGADGTGDGTGDGGDDGGQDGGGGDGDGSGDDGDLLLDVGSTGGDGNGGDDEGGGDWDEDPVDCAQAAENATYVGCDFYPTVLPNVVKGYFDYAVVVANAGDTTADVTIERDGVEVAVGTVAPDELETFYLPWVDELKHYDYLCDTDLSQQPGPLQSKRVEGGAYHLSTTAPVTVYQFNPLEYEGVGGPPGKSWEGCDACWPGCNSYTNDAALLLPSTALTGSYVVASMRGGSYEGVEFPAYVAITGLHDGTDVAVKVSADGAVIAGDGIAAAGPGDVFNLPIDQGEVVLLMGTAQSDLGGTIVWADQPVQVMAGMPHTQIPFDRQASDHLEETVFPVETLGTHYFVTRPTGPEGNLVPQMVRIFGVVDGTSLTYPSGAPPGAPTSVSLGEVHDLGIVDMDFEIEGDEAFEVATFQLAGTMVAGGMFSSGDPAQSTVASVEQYRKKYVFLAPTDYEESFATLVRPVGLPMTLDGIPITFTPEPIGNSGWEVVSVPLTFGNASGAHVLEAADPFGLQVMGYGFATSYQYPGGLNLKGIRPPLPPPEG